MTEAKKIRVKVLVKDGQTKTTKKYELGLIQLLFMSMAALGSKDTEIGVTLTFHKGVPAELQKELNRLKNDMRL